MRTGGDRNAGDRAEVLIGRATVGVLRGEFTFLRLIIEVEPFANLRTSVGTLLYTCYTGMENVAVSRIAPKPIESAFTIERKIFQNLLRLCRSDENQRHNYERNDERESLMKQRFDCEDLPKKIHEGESRGIVDSFQY